MKVNNKTDRDAGVEYENVFDGFCDTHSWQIFLDGKCSKCDWDLKIKPVIEDSNRKEDE